MIIFILPSHVYGYSSSLPLAAYAAAVVAQPAP